MERRFPRGRRREDRHDDLASRRSRTHGEAAGAVIIGRDMREQKDAEREVRRVRDAARSRRSNRPPTASSSSATAAAFSRYNQRFADMWRIPAELLEDEDDRGLIAHSCSISSSIPNSSCARSKALYAQPEAESFDLLEFKDGRRFERYSIGRAVEGDRQRARLELPRCHRRVSRPRRRCASRSCGTACCSSRTPPASA